MPQLQKMAIALLSDTARERTNFIKALLEEWGPSFLRSETFSVYETDLKNFDLSDSHDLELLVRQLRVLDPNIVIMHLALGGLEGKQIESLSEEEWMTEAPRLRLVQTLRKEIPHAKIITYSRMQYSKAVFLAASLGAFDFVQIKPEQGSWDRFLSSVKEAIEDLYRSHVKAFILMPFQDRFNDIYTYGIKATCEKLNIKCERADEVIYTRDILRKIYECIRRADLIIADLTTRNPNVFYEVGYAHALRKTVILLASSARNIPFDLRGDPVVVYGKVKGSEIKTLSSRLEEILNEIVKAQLCSHYPLMTFDTTDITY